MNREQMERFVRLELLRTAQSTDLQPCLNPACKNQFVDFSTIGDTEIVCPKCGKNLRVEGGTVKDREGYSTPYRF